MTRIISVYGIIAGVIVAIGMWLGITFVPKGGSAGLVVGYLSMLVALSMVFVGVKQYRDVEKGGVIRFWPALGVGIGIACVAGLFYVLAWEVYLYSSGYTFFENYFADYVRDTVKSMTADGKSAADIAKFKAEMASFKEQYANPLFRMTITLSEIAPVGLLVAFISAALLRNSSFMPAKAAG
ncbi:MAG: DUF4199 domain-containing protein [Sphingorhabdus sp.]